MRMKCQAQDGQTAGLTRSRNLCAALGLGLFYTASKMISAQWPPAVQPGVSDAGLWFLHDRHLQHKDLNLLRRSAAKGPKQQIHV